jgi:hypothetical protein
MRKIWPFEVLEKQTKRAKGGATWNHWKDDMWKYTDEHVVSMELTWQVTGGSTMLTWKMTGGNTTVTWHADRETNWMVR